MVTRMIDGKAVSDRRRTLLRTRVQALAAQGVTPCLAAITVRADHGWSVYLKGQASASATVGVAHRIVELPAGAQTDDLLEAVEALNLDAGVHGIIVQSPLPPGFDAFAVQARISPDKDIEGVGPSNLGLVLAGRPALAPCTALSAVALAQEALPDLKGVEAVVVGASTIVGRPVAALLTAAGATATVCQITTKDVAAHCRRAELVIVAVGKAGLVKADWIKPGAVVVDVGINRITGPDGKGMTVGDVHPDVAQVAGWLTPVPGGVGSLTTTILLESTVLAAENLGRGAATIDPASVQRLLGGLDLPAATSERIALLLSRHLVGATAVRGTPLERRLAQVSAGAGALLLDGDQPAGADPLGHPDLVLERHRASRAAGADVLTTATAGMCRFRETDRERLVRRLQAGARLARQAAGGAFVLGAAGPLHVVVGAEIDAAGAADAYAEIALAMQDAGVDGFIVDGLPSAVEAAAALEGIHRVSRLPILVSRLLTRADPGEIEEFVAATGAAAVIGVTGAGPRTLLPVAAALAATGRPVYARPDAGVPTLEAGQPHYHLRPAYLAQQAKAFLAAGVGILGGGRGIGPEHLAALAPLRGAPVAAPVVAAGGDGSFRWALPPPHPLLTSLREGKFAALAFLPGRLTPGEAVPAAMRLASAGADAVGLLAGWPGSASAQHRLATLKHLEGATGIPGVLDLVPAAWSLAAAEEHLLAAHLLGLRLVVVDAGVFAPGGEATATLRMLWLLRRLNQGRSLTGGRLEQATAFVVAVRVRLGDTHLAEYVAAGADALFLQPVYAPKRFRAWLTEATALGIPLLAEVLLLPDAATADELDNEIPALAVPETLKQRLEEDPEEDVRGVLRFLAAWRQRPGALSGVCVLAASAQVEAAERVLRACRG